MTIIRKHRIAFLAACAFASLVSMPLPGRAQLADCQLIDEAFKINAPGGCIAKPLREQIGQGQGSITTPYSSIYIIKRDPARSIRRGRQLFQRKFSLDEGLGPRLNAFSRGDITKHRALGAGLSDSCASCHGRPRGSAGAGGDVATFPDSRDAPHLFGLGLIEMLSDEITADLRAIRDKALSDARGDAATGVATSAVAGGEASGGRPPGNGGKPGPVTARLVSKGIEFGRITALPDGSVDTSEVRGVDADLRVKPFLHQGITASIREFIVGALNAEMGLQAWDPILCAATDPVTPQTRTSPSGFKYDPTLDKFERPPSCSNAEDPDGDGHAGEIDPALVDHLEFYLLNYFKPGQYRTTPRSAEGLRFMEQIGCTTCHVRNLEVRHDRRVADAETTYDPERGIFNELFTEVYPLFGPLKDDDAYPQLLPIGGKFLVENVFTDLKRHDLGPNFHERDFDGSRITSHVTEPLWGVASTAPYGHDGRSVNLDAVIRRHGGEAEEVAQKYIALSSENQSKITDFLQSLVLFPPDDTASSLNPGVPGSDDPQNPTNHGNINLGLLFQLGYGAE